MVRCVPVKSAIKTFYHLPTFYRLVDTSGDRIGREITLAKFYRQFERHYCYQTVITRQKGIKMNLLSPLDPSLPIRWFILCPRNAENYGESFQKSFDENLPVEGSEGVDKKKLGNSLIASEMHSA